MKPILMSIIIGVGIVIVAAGFLTRDIPVERIVSDIDEPTITPASPIQEEQESVSVVSTTKENCDSSYPDVCIASYPPDLDCDEIGYSNFVVVGDDPHGFDTDNNGIGCEVGSPQSTNPISNQLLLR